MATLRDLEIHEGLNAYTGGAIANAVKDIVAGTGTLPQTVVLNRRGEVIYNKSGSVTPELLEALYKQADQ